MKTVTARTILLFLLCASFVTQAKVDIPDGVRYKKASDKINKNAKRILKRAFRKKKLHSIFSQKLVCGPGLWRAIKDHHDIGALKITPAKFHVPISKGPNAGKFQKLRGALFQKDKEIRILSKLIQVNTENGINIRKLNRNEIIIYWGLIPYDIEEPVFIIESGKLHYLVDVLKKNNKIFWIDEVSTYRIRKK